LFSNSLATNFNYICSLFVDKDANLPASTMIIQVPYTNSNSNINSDIMSSSPIPTRTGSFRINDSQQANISSQQQQQQLPKPSIPPPSIPGRPPPIGFNSSVLPLSTTENHHQLEPPNSLPYPLVSPLYPVPSSLDSSSASPSTPNNMGGAAISGQNQHLNAPPTSSSSSSASSSTSSTISVSLANNNNNNQSLHSPNGNGSPGTNGQFKPPKPILPRKPVNSLVAQHINKFETSNNGGGGGGGKHLEDLIDQPDEQTSPSLLSKASQEVTFL
jgi:hypothetical protein